MTHGMCKHSAAFSSQRVPAFLFWPGCSSAVSPCVHFLSFCHPPCHPPVLVQERLERRKVHEQLQVLRGNIRVCCRVRPSLRCSNSPAAAGSFLLLVPLYLLARGLMAVPIRTLLAPAARPCCSPGIAGAGSGKEAACGVSYPYSGSLCIHANERRQQEFEFDAVFDGEASQVGCQCRPLCVGVSGSPVQAFQISNRSQT